MSSLYSCFPFVSPNVDCKEKFENDYKKSLHYLTVKRAKTFVLKLPQNWSTGNSRVWYLPDEIKLIKKTSIRPKDYDPELIGQGHFVEYTFSIEEPGVYSMFCEYAHQWSIAEEPHLPERYIIEVK